MRRSERTTPRASWVLVVLMVVGVAAGMTVAAVPVGAQSSGDASFDSVTAEVTDQTLFGQASEVTFEYQADANAEVEFTVVGSGSTTETSDGSASTATVRTGGWFTGASYPVQVVAKVGDQVCTATIEKGDGAVDVCETDVSDATFDSAAATVTKHSFWTGEVRTVSFTFETDPGTPVDLTVDDRTRSVTATDGQTTAKVRVGGWFHGAEYPLEVSASTPSQTLEATIERGDGTVNLLEDATPRPNFAVDITADQTVIEGETVSVEGTVENTGDAAGTQDVTVAIADQSTTESISLDAGESATVSLTWATETGDAGAYDATIESDNDSASTGVTVEQPPEPAFFDVGIDATSPVPEGDTVVVDATATNTGEQTGTQDVTVAIDGQSTTESVTLDPGQSQTVTLEWATADGDAGNYTATAQSANDSASQAVEVTEPLEPASFSVDVETTSPVDEGDTLEVTGTVTNVGQSSGTKDVTVSVADQSTTETVTLAGGDSTTVSLQWTTASGDAGNYTASVSSPDDSASASVTVNPVADPTESFSAYVAGEEGYLHTGTDQGTTPIEFTECANFEPTQAELNQTPNYLPTPECITINGTIDHNANTWEGDVDFPTTVMEQTHDILGDLYVEANIATDAEGITGTWNEDTGTITANMTVTIDVAIYDVSSHGVEFDSLTSSDRVTDATCHIPDVSLNPSTENSFQTASSYPNTTTVAGEPLANGEAFLVSNNFPVNGAADCGSLAGFVDLNGAINDELGTPADPGNSEVAFDVVFDFEE